MSNDQSTTQEAAQSSGGEPVGAQIEVNLSEKDSSKVISHIDAPEPETQTRDTDSQRSTHPRLDREIAKRIGRLSRSFDQRLADQEAQHQREMANVRQELQAVRTRTTQDVDGGDLQSELQQLEDQYAAALEEGDSAKAAKINTKISMKTAELQAARQRPAQRDVQPTSPATRQQNNGAGGPTNMGKRFINANADWWNDPEFRIERSAAIVIDEDLIQDGFDPNSEEFYEELKSRLVDKFPNFDVSLPGSRKRQQVEEDEDDEPAPPRRVTQQQPVRRPTSVSAGVNRGERNGAIRKEAGRIRLNATHIENMRRFGLDPDNQKHVVQYANEVRDSEG